MVELRGRNKGETNQFSKGVSHGLEPVNHSGARSLIFKFKVSTKITPSKKAWCHLRLEWLYAPWIGTDGGNFHLAAACENMTFEGNMTEKSRLVLCQARIRQSGSQAQESPFPISCNHPPSFPLPFFFPESVATIPTTIYSEYSSICFPSLSISSFFESSYLRGSHEKKKFPELIFCGQEPLDYPQPIINAINSKMERERTVGRSER